MNIIADRKKISIIIERIAYQIAEDHHNLDTIDIIGVKKSGLVLANEVYLYLKNIFGDSKEVSVYELEIDKQNPVDSNIKFDCDIEKLKNRNIILVDDVINSGRTLFYALKPFMKIPVNQINTLVLVERIYKKYPIIADYVGISLNTTMLDHIEVSVKADKVDKIELI